MPVARVIKKEPNKRRVVAKRSELEKLEVDIVKKAEEQVFEMKKEIKNDVKHDEKVSFILLIVSCVGMGIFVLSGLFMNPDQTKITKPLLNVSWPGSAKKACSINDGNYTACVDGQKQGSGCVWYANCNKCVNQDLPDITSVCNK
ncbi:MAG: hypothetical protein WCO78_03755 [Candidatus Roizmanbacteria bacterium]